MPALNYKKEFAEPVRKKQKPCTIRRMRKRPFVEGDTLYHYTGLRSSKCEKLLENKALAVFSITIEQGEKVHVNGHLLEPNYLRELAQIDGFSDEQAFMDFFKEEDGIPFIGQLIMWNELYAMAFKNLYGINQSL